MTVAFNGHNRIDWKFNNLEQAIESLMTLQHPWEKIDKIKRIYHESMLESLEECDQSLIGLMSLVDVYRSRLFNEPYPDKIDIRPFKMQSPLQHQRRFKTEKLVELAMNVENMKIFLARKYFDYLVEDRMVKNKGDFYMYTKNIFEKIDAIEDDDETKLNEIRAEFEAYHTEYVKINVKYSEMNETL